MASGEKSGIVRDFGAGTPKTLWRVQVAGGYAGAAISQGRVLVTDFTGQFDEAPDPDKRSTLRGEERVHCFSFQTGEPLWRHAYACDYKISYPAGPRATPTVDGQHVYILGAVGDLHCLDIDSGEVVWKRNLPSDYGTEPPMWGYAAHPLVVEETLVCLVGGEGSAVVAFNKDTGEERWRALTTPDIGYSPPTLVQAGGRSQLLVWHSKSLNSLEPTTGNNFWSYPLEPDYSMSITPPTMIGSALFVGAIKDKCMALRLDNDAPQATVMWKGNAKQGVGPSHCPVVADQADPRYFYGVNRGGELRCVELESGKQLWQTYALMASKRRSNSGTAFIVPNGDRYFIFSETGELIIAKLSAEGYEEIDRTQPLLEATHDAFGRGVVWCAPAFAEGSMLVRNDKELIRVSLKQP